MVSSEQVVKPRLAVVKPEVLHLLECQLLYRVSIRARSIKRGVVLIKWAWPANFTTPPS